MPRKQEYQKCVICKKRAELRSCCHRYLCSFCHMQECAIAQNQATLDRLKHLVRSLHIALNRSIAGEAISSEEKENLDEKVADYASSNEEKQYDLSPYERKIF